MSKRTVSLVAFVAATLLLNACGMRVIHGSGEAVSETRAVSDFNQVTLAGIGEVIITQGETEALTIEAEDNILPYLETTVRNGVLTIGIKQDAWGMIFSPTRPIKFYLSVKNVEALTISGSGDIRAEQLDAGRLALDLSGSGKIELGDVQAESLTSSLSGSGDLQIAALAATTVNATLSGSGNYALGGEVEEVNVTISGSGSYRADDLQSQTAQVTVSGSGAAALQVANSLDVNITGSGDVRYAGAPQVSQHITGSGQVRQVNMP